MDAYRLISIRWFDPSGPSSSRAFVAQLEGTPLDDDPPAVAREKALARPYKEWCEFILSDLARAHPGIDNQVTNLDVLLWGHAMVRPVPGFIWGKERQKMQDPIGNIVFAHSDLSGIAIFEEAYTRGVRAADSLLDQMKTITDRN